MIPTASLVWLKKRIFIITALTGIMHALPGMAVDGVPRDWLREWPDTDFSKHSVEFKDIISGGPPKDGIPAIDNPRFKSLIAITDIKDTAPVISLQIGNDARAYPLSILMFHEIVNDTVGGVPVAVTYCPLCNAALVFRREVNGKMLDFGTTGKLRYSDMVMYDRQTESWWQQFLGEGIVGQYNGMRLEQIPSRIESFALFRERHRNGKVLVPNSNVARSYGRNPYMNYGSSEWPFLFRGDYDGPVPPLARVVAVGNDAWPLDLIRQKGKLSHDGLIIRWQSGQNSALDSSQIDQGRDVGNITVQRYAANGKLEDVIHHIPFAFAFKTFHPDGIIHKK